MMQISANTIETAIAALEYQRDWIRSNPTFYTLLDKEEERITELVNIDAALAELTALQQADSAAVDAPTGWPHSDGYFAFEGRVLGSSVENLRWCVMVRMSKMENEYYAYRFGGFTLKVTNMIGTWVKLRMPWDSAAAPLRWTEQQVRGVLGDPINGRDDNSWIDYEIAFKLCMRIIGHYETWLRLGAPDEDSA